MTSYFPLLLLLQFLHFTLILAGNCSSEQSSYLLQLKKGFSSFSPKLSNSWQPGTNCCSWYGVTCDSNSGLITALNLSNCSISGTIDHALFNLTSLKYLNLSLNKLDRIEIASLPFDKLWKLVRLDLSNAGKFEGQIPGSIGQLRKLVALDLSRSYLEVLPSTSLKLHDPSFRAIIQNLTRLKKLVLDAVNISASGLEWGGAVSEFIPRIHTLSLVACSLSGPIDPALANLTSLVKLHLDQNNLSSTIHEFFSDFKNLSSLHLQSCALQGKFPEKILQLPKLKYVDISNNLNLFGKLPEFPEGSQLRAILLSNTNLSGTLPESIGNLRSLTILELFSCRFHGSLPASFGNLTKLEQLDLSFNKFSGQIPQSLNWSNISEIDLSNNNFSGSILHFGSVGFQNLENMDFSVNSFSGSIPAHLFGLPSLKSLLLGQNKLSGHLECLSNVSSLQTVDLSDNELEGPIPDSLFQLSGIKVLNLASNKFRGTLQLDKIIKLKDLSILDLSNNKLSVKDGPSNFSFSAFPKIGTLKLASCNLTEIPGFLQSQDKIEILDLSNNRIGGIIPGWIWSIGNGTLAQLNLSCNLFTSVEGSSVHLSLLSPIILDLHSNKLQGSFPFLPINTIVLDYSDNRFSDSININFTSYLNYTVFLSVANNHLYGEIPPSICNAAYLQVLDLSNNNLNGSIPPCLMDSFTDLRVLNLGRNQLNGSQTQNMSRNCSLHTLNLNNNQLAGLLPQWIKECKLLEVLDLGNNLIVDSFPYWLGNLLHLRVLVLRSNRFHGSLLELPRGTVVNANNTCGFAMLQIFDVSDNNFTGHLPADCFKNLEAMKLNSDGYKRTLGFQYLNFSPYSYYQNTVAVTLKGQDITLQKILTIFTSADFSSNKFSGTIPQTIGELNSLLLLNLSHNSLTGRIPTQLGNLSELEALDLSSNKLSGVIPQELANLNFLSFLNLSYNKLVGTIPQSRQLSTFLNNSYLGNRGLCGFPLIKQCDASKGNDTLSNMYFPASLVELNWEFIFIGLGFGVGLAVMVALVMVWPIGKNWHDRHVDIMLMAIMTPLFSIICGNKKIGDKDAVTDSIESKDDGRRFCIFCTKLEFHEGRGVVHHVDCSCPRLHEKPSELDCTKHATIQRNKS